MNGTMVNANPMSFGARRTASRQVHRHRHCGNRHRDREHSASDTETTVKGSAPGGDEPGLHDEEQPSTL